MGHKTLPDPASSYTVSDRFCQLTYEKDSCHSSCLHKEQESSAKDNNENACYKIICLNLLFKYFLGNQRLLAAVGDLW